MANRGGLINSKMTNKFLEVLIFSDGEPVNQQYVEFYSDIVFMYIQRRIISKVMVKNGGIARNFSIYGNLCPGWLKRSIYYLIG